ncbi:hypothetical protein [Antrihabitans stalactiti]|uniref:Uncharacterized protein n=1 Tax=Antrihabitans stalactiti TaxID=2584121 RepID=A0A848K8Z7_9NOCA|nr:hypothetical protein [Antrihabitans stalactiti]NMN93898.1 hypothetical protein [Antrihabitans stalactiti]
MTESSAIGDFGNCDPWPEGLFEHLDTYRQGHIIENVPAFFLEAALAPIWSPPRQQLSSLTPTIAGEFGYGPMRAMMLTQACDLLKRTNPWITVAPVYDAANRLQPGQHGQVRSGQFGHFIPITADWATSGLWVADLRLEMPLEKTVLIGQTPLEAFGNDLEYALLARKLGARRQRLAAPLPCIAHLSEPLYDGLRRQPDGGEALNAHVRELRVQWNDPTNPTVLALFVVALDESERSQIDVDGWTELVLSLYQSAYAEGVTIVGPEFTSIEVMSAADYVTSSLIEDTQSS